MSSFAFELMLILLLILLNGGLVMSEMAIVSARKVRLQQMANQGNVRARLALDLANSPNKFLSTVQIGITLLAIVSGAFGESTVSKHLTPYLEKVPVLEPYKHLISATIAVLIITYLTLIVGELVPKRLALNHPERIATVVVFPMRMMATVTAPIVHLLSLSTEAVLRLLGISASEEPLVTEEEIKVLLEQGTEEGTFEEAEQDMVERVLRLDERRASALMTPRPDIIWLDLEDPIEENRRKITENIHARFPVCQGGLDNILGIIQVNDLLAHTLSGESLDLTTYLQQPVFVPESTRTLKVLELFKQSRTHLALVVDEYGVIQGVITLTDILEAIVGDLPSVEDLDEPQAVQREDGSWLLDGMLPIDNFREIFEIEEIPVEDRGSYHTLGGFVVMQFGRIPAAADHFVWEQLRFEVMDMDANRVDKVLVSPIQPEPHPTADNDTL